MTWLIGLIFLSSLFLTGVLRAYAVKKKLMDYPNARSSHAVATPRGGGLAIVISFSFAVAVLYTQGSLGLEYLLAFVVAGGMVAAIGYWDDHGHIPARWRIVVHFVAAGLVMFWLDGPVPIQLGSIDLRFGWFGYLVGAMALVWLLNLYNFMDGVDGIASVEAITVTGGASLISHHTGHVDGAQAPIIILQFALLAAVLGFLLWNWPPARIFMGDVGSGFLGFAIGILAYVNVAEGLLATWSWLILLGIFLVDATITLIRRFLRRARWHEAHRSHAYQHAVRRWKSHGKVSCGVAVINAFWLLPLAWLASVHPAIGWILAFIAMLPLVGLAFWLDAGIEEENVSA